MSVFANETSVGGMASSADGSSDNTDPLKYKILALTFNQDCTYEFSRISNIRFFFKYCRALAMGTVKSYSLFTINQDNKAEEIHDCGKQEMNAIDLAKTC